MFEDYKIPIAFLILVLIIILGVKAQAQNIILFDDDDYTGFWTPANLPIDTTSTSVYFYGEAPKTKVAKDSGGVSFRPYMWVIADSVGATADSTYGYTHTITRPSDTTDYIYKQIGFWVQRDKDTIWVYADADTATVYPCDITPTQFVFTDITNAEINTQYTSDSIIVAGLTCETTLTVDAIQPLVSSEYQINDGIWVSDEVVGVVDNGDEIKIKATTVGSYNGSIDIVASVNSVEDTLTITTKADNINYMITADGDTMFTAEGDTMKTSYNFNFNKTNGEKNEEDIILPQRVYAVLDSKRTMGFTV